MTFRHSKSRDRTILLDNHHRRHHHVRPRSFHSRYVRQFGLVLRARPWRHCLYRKPGDRTRGRRAAASSTDQAVQKSAARETTGGRSARARQQLPSFRKPFVGQGLEIPRPRQPGRHRSCRGDRGRGPARDFSRAGPADPVHRLRCVRPRKCDLHPAGRGGVPQVLGRAG